MRNMRRLKSLLWVSLAVAGIIGCSSVGLAQEPAYESVFEHQEQPDTSAVGQYDSADTAIVLTVDTEEYRISLINAEMDKSYTLEYNGTTLISDKYGTIMSMPQVQAGDIVDVFFMKEEKKLAALQLSSEAFLYESISRYSLDGSQGSAVIGNDQYRISNSALIISEGRRVEPADIISKDIVTMKGIGRRIYSIVVEKGHGYLRLENDTYVIGGWIEAGQVIQQISEDMLLTVPEGSTEVHITAPGIDEYRTVHIERNTESVIDLGDLELEAGDEKTGKIYFTVHPDSAAVYVDDEEIDSSEAVELEYGMHKIVCEASGYDTVTQYILVNQDMASVTITLDEASEPYEDEEPALEEESPGGVSDNSPGVSGNSLSVSGNSLVTGSYRVYIDAPKGVEVYEDNIYMGITPTYFSKKAGSHTITLRKEGYITKSYTIQIDGEQRDVTYSFPDLEKKTESDEDPNEDNNDDDSSDDKDNDNDGDESDDDIDGDSDQNDVSDNSLSDNSLT